MKHVLLSFVTSIALSVVCTENALAFCRTTTVRATEPGTCSTEGIPLAWKRPCVGFSLFSTGSPEIDLASVRIEAIAAASRWHAVTCSALNTQTPSFAFVPINDVTTPTGYNRTGPNANTVSFNTTWKRDAFHRTGTIAVTIITFDKDSGEIVDADVELNQVSDDNPDGYSFTVGTVDLDKADLPTVLTHEFGHVHGLGHSDESTAVMWPEAGLGEQRRTLRNDDVSAVCAAYPPSTLTETCNPTPTGGLALTPSGGKVTGSCSITHREQQSSPMPHLLLLAVGTVFGNRRRQRV